MGLFSRKTKIYVASSAYNLAGDVNARPNYMKTTVVGSMLSESGFSMVDTINNSYMNGPGIRMRLYSSWSKNHFDSTIGVSYGALNIVADIDIDAVANEIPAPINNTTFVQNAEIGFADFTQWCDQYIYNNAPSRINEPFEVDIDANNVITMTSTIGGSTITFTPPDFIPGKLYLYADYSFYSSPVVSPPAPGAVTTYYTEAELPTITGWTSVSNTPTSESTPLVKTTTIKSVYSDGRPDETTTSTDNTVYNWSSYVKEYKRAFNISPDTSTVVIDNRQMIHNKIGSVVTNTTSSTQVVDIGGGVTKTVTTTVDTQSVKIQYTNQYITNITTSSAVGSPKMFIYGYQTGNANLDVLFETKSTNNRFYSFIPIRKDWSWIDGYSVYPLCVKAFKKATGGKLSEVITTLKKNNDIGDIQYIYAAFGCSLNSPENTAKEYIYRFFQMALASFPPDPNYPTLDSLLDGFAKANAQADVYENYWKNNTTSGGTNANAPSAPVYPTIPSRSFNIRGSRWDYNMSVSWNFSFETFHSGQAWTGAKQGQLRTRYAGNLDLSRSAFRTNEAGNLVRVVIPQQFQELEIVWQTSSNTYKKLRLFGLVHNNHVYRNKYVTTDVAEAMGDSDESGFIIPLHSGIYHSMSLTHSTQLSTACTYLILNSYKKVKKKWYQTGAFKIAVIVVAIVISVFTAGAGGVGILGAYGAVGASLGFVGMAAVIVGAVANVIAAMVLMSIIQTVSISLFGDKIGLIVSAIASVVAMNVGTSLSMGNSMSTMFGNMMSASNITTLTSSVGNGISQYINASTVDTIRKTEELMQKYNTESKAIQSKYEEMFGTSGMGVIDPMEFVSLETMDSFLSRTLMTGTDIAGMSMDMISEFTASTLNLDLA